MDMTPILQPIEEGAVTAAGLAIATGVGLGLKWLSAHLKILQTSEAQKMIVGANAIVQSAAENASAKIVADIHAGKLDPTNRAGLLVAANDAVAAVKAKVPDAITLLKPEEGALAGLIADKAVLVAAKAASAPQPAATTETAPAAA